jgi:hypothetical protein
LNEDEMRDLLHQAADALTDVGKKALVVKPSLDHPYLDEPSWTPWTRFMGPAATRAYNLGIQIDHQLRMQPPEPIISDDEPMRA